MTDIILNKQMPSRKSTDYGLVEIAGLVSHPTIVSWWILDFLVYLDKNTQVEGEGI